MQTRDGPKWLGAGNAAAIHLGWTILISATSTALWLGMEMRCDLF